MIKIFIDSPELVRFSLFKNQKEMKVLLTKKSRMKKSVDIIK